MAVTKITYASSSALTITLASLATSSGLTVGRQATAVDNTTNTYLDYELNGKITTGTTPTAGTIEVWVVRLLDDSTWPDTFGASDAGVTITSRDELAAYGKLAQVIPTDTTSNRVYYFAVGSVAQLFGGICPLKFAVFVVHNTVSALNATGGNHAINQKGSYLTTA